MRKQLVVIAYLLLVVTSSCATYRPIVDQRSIRDVQQYQFDLAECQSYAQQIDAGASAGAGMITGAAIGAGLGAIVGAFFGRAGDGAAMGAALGGAQGVTQGAAYGAATQRDIVIRCLQGRGYTVLY